MVVAWMPMDMDPAKNARIAARPANAAHKGQLAT